MSQTLVARATSFGASALLMGGLVLLALTMSYTISEIDFGPSPAPIEMAVPEPPPPTPPPPQTQPQAQPISEATDISPLPPLLQTDVLSSPQPTESYFEPVGPVEITSPRWQVVPRNLQRYYPRRALERNIEGQALLDCLVDVAGALHCRVISETPTGWGFGDAALRIAAAYRMNPATRNGAAVEGRYAMRVPFDIE